MTRTAGLNESANLNGATDTVVAGTAVPAAAAGCYYERPPAPPLRHIFACTWVHEMPRAGAPPVMITADGTIDLQWIDGQLRVAGPDRACQTEALPAGAIVIGFRFHPAVASSWLGVSAVEIVDRRVPLEDVWGARGARLARALTDESRDTSALIAAIEAALASQMPARETSDAVMRAAYHLIAQGAPAGAPFVPRLGRALAMSERTMRRRFEESFGYGPKTLERILRYQRFLRLARAASAPAKAGSASANSSARSSLATLAAEAGYADQAHLARESRRLTGITPQALERLLRADR